MPQRTTEALMFDNPLSGAAALKLWRMGLETWLASLYVIAERSRRIGVAAFFPAAFDPAEFGRMVPEKADAWTEAMFGLARARTPLEAAARTLTPLHRRATANARRLSRRQ